LSVIGRFLKKYHLWIFYLLDHAIQISLPRPFLFLLVFEKLLYMNTKLYNICEQPFIMKLQNFLI